MERWLSYKGTCHVILLLAKLHDMYLYKTATFPHQLLKSVSRVAFFHRFRCKCLDQTATLLADLTLTQRPPVLMLKLICFLCSLKNFGGAYSRRFVRASVCPCVRASVPLLSTQILGNCLSDINETSWEY